MKLNHELLRRILLQVEARPANRAGAPIKIDDVDDDVIMEHVQLLFEGGYIEASFTPTSTGGRRIYVAMVSRLTLEGHDFLNNMRNDNVWNRATTFLEKHGGNVSLQMLKIVLENAVRQLTS